MFVTRAGDSVMRGSVDENSSLLRSKTTAKTPVTSAKTPKRRAFGDISNRKTGGAAAATTTIAKKNTPQASILPTQKQSVVPSSATTRKVTFAAPKHRNTTTTPTVLTTKKHAPVEDVELSAGRVWSDQVSFDDDGDEAIREILEENNAWQDELVAFVEEERTRPMRIRDHQNALAEQELQQKMEALWKQDDEGEFHICLLRCALLIMSLTQSSSSTFRCFSRQILRRIWTTLCWNRCSPSMTSVLTARRSVLPTTHFPTTFHSKIIEFRERCSVMDKKKVIHTSGAQPFT